MTSALVLGGGGGIGAAICRMLATQNDVLLTYREAEDRAESLAQQLRVKSGRAIVAHRCDATSASDVERAFAAAQGLGDLSAAVFCVGGWTYPKLSELDEAAIRAEVDLNLISALLFLAGCARHLQEGGRVVLLSSASAVLAPARQATYAAAKAGLEAAARVAAKELAPRRITVNVVRPGATDTETLRRGTSQRAIEAMSGANAMKRLGTPEDIAGAVAMLVAPPSAWVTGTIIDATGGLY